MNYCEFLQCPRFKCAVSLPSSFWRFFRTGARGHRYGYFVSPTDFWQIFRRYPTKNLIFFQSPKASKILLLKTIFLTSFGKSDSRARSPTDLKKKKKKIVKNIIKIPRSAAPWTGAPIVRTCCLLFISGKSRRRDLYCIDGLLWSILVYGSFCSPLSCVLRVICYSLALRSSASLIIQVMKFNLVSGGCLIDIII